MGLSNWGVSTILLRVNRLTKQEQMVLCLVLALLLTGWAVKTWRTARPAALTVQPAEF